MKPGFVGLSMMLSPGGAVTVMLCDANVLLNVSDEALRVMPEIGLGLGEGLGLGLAGALGLALGGELGLGFVDGVALGFVDGLADGAVLADGLALAAPLGPAMTPAGLAFFGILIGAGMFVATGPFELQPLTMQPQTADVTRRRCIANVPPDERRSRDTVPTARF